MLLLLAEREVHVDLSYNLDRLSIEKGRLIYPLFHRFQSGWNQQRVAADCLKILRIVPSFEMTASGATTPNAGLFGQRRIDRLWVAGSIGVPDIAADGDTLRSRSHFLLRRRRRRSGGVALVDHPMMPPSTPPGAPPATPPGTPPTTSTAPEVGGGSSFFLMVAISFGTDFGAHEFAGVELAPDHLDLNGEPAAARWRRWRRRGWRRHPGNWSTVSSEAHPINHGQNYDNRQKN